MPALVVVLFLALSVPAFAEYRTFEVESLRVTIDSDWASQGGPGYFPLRFDITNLGEDRTIEILVTGESWSMSRYYRPTGPFFAPSTQMGRWEARQALSLKRGDRVRPTVPIPVAASTESIRVQIRERGRPLQGINAFAGFQSGAPTGNAPVLFVVSGAVSPEVERWRRAVPAGPRGGFVLTGPPPGSSGPAPTPRLDFILDPSRLPVNWIGYTTLRAIAIGPGELRQLTPPQKDALLTWTAAGGDLLLIDGGLDMLFPSSTTPSPGSAPQNYFFGHIFFLSASDFTALGTANVLRSVDAETGDDFWALPANRAVDWDNMGERGFRLPIPGVEGVPRRSYLAILVLFSVLIGPVNYIYLWRKRLQVLMVLTVPLCSAVFILLLAGYAILGEGLGVRGRAVTFTILDERSRQAVTRSSVSLYAAGIAPGSGLRFPSDVAVYPRGADTATTRSWSLNLTEAQQFSDGLLQARAPANFEQVRFRAARERLTFTRNGDNIQVTNGLGASISRLYYQNGGAIYTLGGPLGAGEQGTLQPGELKGTDLFPDPPAFSAMSSLKFYRLAENTVEGAYLAVLESSPFWEPGVENVDERGSYHLVLGSGGGAP